MLDGHRTAAAAVVPAALSSTQHRLLAMISTGLRGEVAGLFWATIAEPGVLARPRLRNDDDALGSTEITVQSHQSVRTFALAYPTQTPKILAVK